MRARGHHTFYREVKIIFCIIFGKQVISELYLCNQSSSLGMVCSQFSQNKHIKKNI